MMDTLTYFQSDRFINHIDARLVEAHEGYAKAVMTVAEHHLNGYGVCQGGALFTLADLAFAAAVNSHGISTLTTNASITYVKSARLGDRLTAEGHEVVNHHKMPFAEVRVCNQHQELLAVFTASGYRKEKHGERKG
ncbi:phenylacetic acid degradation protein PaaD [Prevotella dentalis DSM 3688]|uniref:Phenylacetic acid degradation protein PaaD n=2 Tax=Prevotella dentalis (strain ATCC 49559 / DSM 3688 / JCM 13448 / NCTC 12043 / ES 2772) TaxID=908937 RepID=F9D1H9_PREDD|nr:phenylacetic acid degradation protein PaaD [Prevotella dentalis DSM 3688]